MRMIDDHAHETFEMGNIALHKHLHQIEHLVIRILRKEWEIMADEQTTLGQIAALNTALDNQTKTVAVIASETAAIRAAQTPGAVPQSVTDALTALGAKDAAIQAALDAEVAADAPPAPPATPAPSGTGTAGPAGSTTF